MLVAACRWTTVVAVTRRTVVEVARNAVVVVGDDGGWPEMAVVATTKLIVVGVAVVVGATVVAGARVVVEATVVVVVVVGARVVVAATVVVGASVVVVVVVAPGHATVTVRLYASAPSLKLNDPELSTPELSDAVQAIEFANAFDNV